MRHYLLGILVLTCTLLHLSPAQAAPSIISMVPLDQATGVSPAAAVVFTFSEAMDTDPNLTVAEFRSLSNPFSTLPTTDVWTVGNTVLTCTPSPAFPANTMIIWSVNGQNPAGDSLEGEGGGFFTTGSGTGGSGGSGTNAITTFSVGKIHAYDQTSSGPPLLDPTAPYSFIAVTGLASNRTATSVTLTLPTASVSNLTQNFFQQESFMLIAGKTNLTTFDNTFPAGGYSFFVQGPASNQTVMVTLPVAAQPNAPHLTDYSAAQAVDSSQAFVLGWDVFAGGTAADFISVEIGTNYRSSDLGSLGALTGAATSFTIPAGTLRTNSTYDSTIGFYRYVGTTNASYATMAYRATYTTFTLLTTGGAATGGPLVLTNASWSSGVFSFDVLCTPGQTVTIETNVLASASGPWPKLLTTNSPGARFHIVSPQAGTFPSLFYRARNGP